MGWRYECGHGGREAGFVQNLLQPLKDGKVRLFLNAGDHVHMHKSLKQCLVDMGIEFKVRRKAWDD